MASRKEVFERQNTMKRVLREECRSGLLLRGQPAPTKRELEKRFGVSGPIVLRVMQELSSEQLFHSVPRVGSFVGPPSAPTEGGLFLFLAQGSEDLALQSPRARDVQAQTIQGFESRMAQLGGTALVFNAAQIRAWQGADMPPIRGVFEWNFAFCDVLQAETEVKSLARVFYGEEGEPSRGADTVSFNDFDGGQQATEHLLSCGHRRIAFLGVHRENEPLNSGSHLPFGWSAAREAGWKNALQTRGLWREEWAFRPHSAPQSEFPHHDDEEILAREAARELVACLEQKVAIEAVVAANDRAVSAIFAELCAAQIPSDLWPAIVGFDNDPTLQGHVVTSLRLPWSEIGRAAAEMLWERAQNDSKVALCHRNVPMSLVPRLSCRPQWSILAAPLSNVALARV